MQYLIQLFRLVAFTTLFTTAFSAAVYSLPTNFVLAQTFVNSSRESEAENLFQQGIQQYEREEFLEARSSWESALILFQEMGNRTREIYSLNNLGLVHQALGEYAKAIEYYSAAWQLVESGSDSADKILVMSNLLEAYWLGGEHQLALDYAQRLIDLTQEAGDRSTQVKVTIVLADTYTSIGQYPQAIELYEEAMTLAQALDDRQQQGNILNGFSWAYFLQGNYRQSVTLSEQALVLHREVANRAGEAIALNQLGNSYVALAQHEKALEFYQEALTISREIGDWQLEVFVLGNLGEVYRNSSQYELAIDFYEQSLAIARERKHLQGELNAVGNLGTVYLSLAQYQQGILFYEEALSLSRQIGDRAGEGILLNNLGEAYRNLGDFQRAIQLHQESLAVAREIGNRQGEANALTNLGTAYWVLGDYQKIVTFYEQSLVIVQEIGDRQGEGIILNNLGEAYRYLGDYAQAIALYEQALAIAREIGDPGTAALPLNNIGLLNQITGNYSEAINYYEQSLVIKREIGDTAGEARTLANLGVLFGSQDQPDLAIVFLKTAVERYESIRAEIRELEVDLQQSYTDTVAGSYRLLADLLLETGRIPEAQQVLDLLKLEELREFTDTTRASWTGTTLAYTDPEREVVDVHGSLIALGGQVIACEATNCAELDNLYDQLEALKAQYDAQVAVFNETVQANRSQDDIFQDPDNLSGEAETLLSAYAANGQNAVLIYPFVLEDKLWLVWAAAGGAIGGVEVPVSQGELAAIVRRLGELLQSPDSLTNLQATSQQLYEWIIQPLEAELIANNIDHLIFVNDRLTRYIPMAVLYDGQQYLLERFTLSTVLAPGLTDTRDRLTAIDESPVLGLGLTQAVRNWNPLPGVQTELDAIVRGGANDPLGIYPGQVLLDDAFTLEALKENVRNYRILHMATHAAFVPGRAEDSFVVLGDGSQLTIRDIEAMERRLTNLHLVVLSACQTALGGSAGDGTEIAGISSYFLEIGRAETVIASLWSVNDISTSRLMQHFYEFLAAGLPKAEALRQAQLTLLYTEDAQTRLAASDRGLGVVTATAPDQPDDSSAQYTHPYYWAPFILIGNGL
jgi:CHAT domain-containing protein/Tfp pilus assembly protein PilF